MDGIGDGAPPCTRRAFFRHASRASAGVAALSVAACAQPLQPTPLRIDRSVRSQSQDARIAPGRKSDPGPLFPWERLYREHGIGAWPDAAAVERHARLQPLAGDTASLQSRLQAYGYDTPRTGVFDEATQQAVIAFQMHFRPARYDGVPDTETAAILDALLEKYRARGRAEGAPGVGAGEEIGEPKEADAR